jgi:hypothetical protein
MSVSFAVSENARKKVIGYSVLCQLPDDKAVLLNVKLPKGKWF